MLVAKVSLVVPMPVASCTKDELQLEVKTTCTEALATLNLKRGTVSLAGGGTAPDDHCNPSGDRVRRLVVY